MRVPVLTRQVQEANTPNVAVQGGITPSQAASMVRNQFGGIGELVSAGAKAYQEFQVEADNARVKQQLVETQNAVNNRVYNPDDGIVTIKGENAISRPDGRSLMDETSSWFGDVVNENLSKLSNPRQKQQYQESVIELQQQLNRTVFSHVFRESENFKKNAYISSVASSSNNIALNYKDPEATLTSINDIILSTDAQAKMEGWDEKRTAIEKVDRLDKAIMSAIGSMQANGDIDSIPSYFARNFDFMTPESQAKVVKLVQDNTATDIEKNLIMLSSEGDIEKIAAYVSGLKNNDYLEKVVGTRNVNSILGKAIKIEEQSYRSIQADNSKKEKEGADALLNFKKDIESGVLPSADRLTSLQDLVRGTDSESEFNALNENLIEYQKLQASPPDFREAYISQVESDLKTSPSDNPQKDAWRINLLKSTHQSLLSIEKDNAPLSYSIKTGKTLAQVPTTSIISGDSQAILEISDNIKKIESVNKVSGVTGSLNPLTKQQQSELKSFVSRAQPIDQLIVATNLLKASGGNGNAARDMLQSVFGENKSYRLAASLNSRGLKDIAGQIITGQDMINKGLVKVPDTILIQKTTEYLKDITSPGKTDFAMFLDSVRAQYAYMAQKGEKLSDKTGKLETKNIDDDLFSQAILKVTGGKFRGGSMFGTKYTVLRPHTVSEESFGNQLKQFNDRHYRDYWASNPDFLSDLPLVQDSKNPNVYYFKNGSGLLLDTATKGKTPLKFIVK